VSEYGERFAQEKAEAKRRNVLAFEARQSRVGTSRATRERTVHRAAKVTWLDPPVLLHPARRILVHGVCADASDAVKAMYL
jgi:hypothetical protein